MIGFIYLLSLTACDNRISPPTKPLENAPKSTRPSKLEQIKHDRILHVLTRNSNTTYYPIAKGYAGLEYDLVMLFAKQLGVKVQFHLAKNTAETLDKIAQSEYDLAAAGLMISNSRKSKIRYSVSYHEVVKQVLYRSGSPEPKTAMDLNAGILEVAKDSSNIESLATLKKTVAPQLTWSVNPDLESNELIDLLDKGLIDYTVADSTQVFLIQRFYPKLQIAFDISSPRQIAWGLPKSTDNSLYDAVNSFFHKIKQDKTLDQLLERYYGHVDALNSVDECKFYQHQQSRLPLYKSYFISAANQQGLDWRLLAAIGYQESHWEHSAISPTGVRGIMMLTIDTALQVGIKDRTDPVQSIKGGALYFQQQLEKIPARITEPDRTWFALAAYNIGYGHLEDARILTQQQGRNPDKWLDVKQSLPLLENDAWFTQTKYGYARGEEPVIYVENIRSYYDLLVWLTTEKVEKKTALQNTNYSIKSQLKKLFQRFFNWLSDVKQQFEVQTASP
jgi:membrane-bound lytic murein transglycosylase F